MTFPQIASDPQVLCGKPVIEGTRISVELILERLMQGETSEQIEASFPHLPTGSVAAARLFARTVIRNKQGM